MMTELRKTPCTPVLQNVVTYFICMTLMKYILDSFQYLIKIGVSEQFLHCHKNSWIGFNMNAICSVWGHNIG